MIFYAKKFKDFKYKIALNPRYEPMLPKNFKKISNTSCVIVWYNPIKDDFHYLIQKRGKNMKSGKSNLAIGGGMLEEYDKTLQKGSIREIMEESQILFKNKLSDTMTSKTIDLLSKNIFFLSKDPVNYTFFMIIVSEKMPKWSGPISKDDFPFKKSSHEIDIEDNTWNNIKLKNRIYKGHCFLTKEEIQKYYDKEPFIWKYSKKSLNILFKILED
jgi:hypothetical protein